MSRDAKQAANAVLIVLRLTRGRFGVWGVIAAIVVGLLYAWIAAPPTDDGGSLPGPTVQAPPAQEPATSQPFLREIGRDAYVSPAGLRYTRGSRHGHRLDHLMSHAHDDPDRDGPHGVFDADSQDAVARVVDHAYRVALQGEADRHETQGERSVYEVNLGQRIGYVGGQTGRRRGHPAAQRVRLIVDGDRFITAFPINP